MRTYIDVSHIINWRGSLTGIERVEYHIIKHYYENTDAEFFYWDVAAAAFVAASRRFVKDVIVDRTSESEMKQAKTETHRTLLARVGTRLKRTAARASVDSMVFGRGTTLVILDGLWDNKHYIAALEALAQQHDLIHVVYDMIPLVQPAYVIDFLPPVFENYMTKILPLCKGVLAISESTARDTRQVLADRRLRVPPIKTFRLGDDVNRSPNTRRPAAVNANEEFVLAVGTVEVRKNHMLMYYAYKKLLSENKDVPTLLIVGRRGLLTGDLQHVIEHDIQLRGKVRILDAVTDAELQWLYEHCLFTVTASFYEGWGLPISESLSYGKVALSSNVSSMPEAGSDLADYFSPFEVEALTRLMLRYLSPRARETREAYIRANYQPYKWEDTVSSFEYIAGSFNVNRNHDA